MLKSGRGPWLNTVRPGGGGLDPSLPSMQWTNKRDYLPYCNCSYTGVYPGGALGPQPTGSKGVQRKKKSERKERKGKKRKR